MSWKCQNCINILFEHLVLILKTHYAKFHQNHHCIDFASSNQTKLNRFFNYFLILSNVIQYCLKHIIFNFLSQFLFFYQDHLLTKLEHPTLHPAQRKKCLLLTSKLSVRPASCQERSRHASAVLLGNFWQKNFWIAVNQFIWIFSIARHYVWGF